MVAENDAELSPPAPYLFKESGPPVSLSRVTEKHSGLGFVSRARMMLGAVTLREKHIASNFWRLAVDDSLASASDMELVGSNFQSIDAELDSGFGSVEVMAQHMWDGHGALLNARPEWRIGVQSVGLAIDAGQMPTAWTDPWRELARDCARRPAQLRVGNYFAYGVRLDNTLDDFRFDGTSGIAGSMYTETRSEAAFLGPQLAVGSVASLGRWQSDLRASVHFGFQRTDLTQTNGFGEDARPGSPNQFLFLEPTYSRYSRVEDGYAGQSELRLTISYYLQPNWSIDAMTRAFVTLPRDTSERLVAYNAPDFGIDESNNSYVAGANVYLGMTYVR